MLRSKGGNAGSCTLAVRVPVAVYLVLDKTDRHTLLVQGDPVTITMAINILWTIFANNSSPFSCDCPLKNSSGLVTMVVQQDVFAH